MTTSYPTKRHILLGKRADMSLLDYHAYWSGPHTNEVIRVSGAQRYIQCHVSRMIWTATAQMRQIAGFVELDYGTPEAYQAVKAKMADRKALLEDEARFLGWWSGSEAVGAPNRPIPSTRRIIGILFRPEGADPAAFRARVQDFIEGFRGLCPCYAEEALTQDIREEPPLHAFEWPDFYLYFDPVRADELPLLTAEDGPLVAGLKALSAKGGAFLTRAEAKLMPEELDRDYWPEP
ncbi:hypothetical protein [Ruixingdingia sedimenti]|uniref:EthD domain-containing protein n=1 Tax=Ruixingdingia sedimenti TaxID=3073604 RepID=A0ABU1FD23_9RHOB|nr:hypothetical protein [Xinfangfangia sp. LG-4]MDR5654796.1 hypothetical protein [Xinfangfangia sp. LG-4]